MVDLKGLKFSKMHGIGNDFPIIDESQGEQIPEADKPEACRQLCHRNFGVGGDGVLFVVPSEVADLILVKELLGIRLMLRIVLTEYEVLKISVLVNDGK